MINIAQALKKATQKLHDSSPTPRLDAEILLAYLLNISQAALYAEQQKILATQEFDAYQKLLDRRQQKEPIAYILQSWDFWSLSLKVTPFALIPRPETELLVELALKILPNDARKVADLGTGTGAIALALAKERSNWQIVATDDDPKALALAKENAEALQLSQVKFYRGNWCEALVERDFNAIISNPPYIASHDPHLVDLTFEPTFALVAGQNGLAHLKNIIIEARDYLVPGGWLMLEHGYDQRPMVMAFLQQAGYSNIKGFCDYAGQPRVLLAKATQAIAQS